MNGDDPAIIYAMPLRQKFYRSSDEEVKGVRHTEAEIERAVKRFDLLADELDPATAEVLRTEDLRGVAVASEAVRANEAQLREAVQIARAHGKSWNEIAVALGVSREAASNGSAPRCLPKIGFVADQSKTPLAAAVPAALIALEFGKRCRVVLAPTPSCQGHHQARPSVTIRP